MLAYLLMVQDRVSHKSVEFDRIVITKNNKRNKERYLKNYIAVSLLSQSFENFETLIKDIYKLHLYRSIKNQTVSEFVTDRNVSDNKYIIKALKSFFPSLQTYLGDHFTRWFGTMEKLRHCIVHTNQIISKNTFNGMDQKILNQYFTIRKNTNDTYNVEVDKNGGNNLLKMFDQYGYNIFAHLSSDEQLPVQLKLIPEKKKLKPIPITRSEFRERAKK